LKKPRSSATQTALLVGLKAPMPILILSNAAKEMEAGNNKIAKHN
jgi:hypothetical protein